MQRLMMSLCAILCALTVSATSASADNMAGPYMAIDGGAGLLNEAHSSDATGSYQTDYAAGSFGALAVGYNLGARRSEERGGRIELEVAYRNNDLKTVAFANSKLDAEGSISALSAMLTSIAESRSNPNYFPYVGIGLGAARVALENAAMAGNLIADDDDVVFAYQFKAGLEIPTIDWLLIDVGYRFFGTTGLEFIDSQGRKVESEYISHNLSLGLRVTF